MSETTRHFKLLNAYLRDQRQAETGSRLGTHNLAPEGKHPVYELTLPSGAPVRVCLKGDETMWFDMELPHVGPVRLYPDSALIDPFFEVVEQFLRVNL